MATVLTDSRHYTAIAGAIREKLGVEDTYTPGEMADAIASIDSGGGFTIAQAIVGVPIVDNVTSDASGEVNE